MTLPHNCQLEDKCVLDQRCPFIGTCRDVWNRWTEDDIAKPAMVEYMARLIELEKAGERTQINIGPLTAIIMIGAFQLATRHPDMPPDHRKKLRHIIDQLKPLFTGTLGEEIIKRGEHPEFDE